MAEGILDFLEFAAAVVLAAPVALLGVLLLTDGDTVGGVGFLAVAAGMVAFDRYVLAPRDLVGRFVADLLGRSPEPGEED